MASKKETKQNINNEVEDTYVDDVVIEEDDTQEAKMKKIKAKLAKCLIENKENLLGWQRSRADFINAKKENEEKLKELISFSRGDFISQILPVVDSFEMAFSNKDAWEKVDKNWRVGVEYIYSQLLSVLENNGLKQVDPIGEKFDPNFHISMEMVDIDTKKDDGIIVDVIQKGYKHEGKVIRPASVKVARYKK